MFIRMYGDVACDWTSYQHYLSGESSVDAIPWLYTEMETDRQKARRPEMDVMTRRFDKIDSRYLRVRPGMSIPSNITAATNILFCASVYRPRGSSNMLWV